MVSAVFAVPIPAVFAVPVSAVFAVPVSAVSAISILGIRTSVIDTELVGFAFSAGPIGGVAGTAYADFVFGTCVAGWIIVTDAIFCTDLGFVTLAEVIVEGYR